MRPSSRIADAQSGVASFAVLDTYNLTVKPGSSAWAPPDVVPLS